MRQGDVIRVGGPATGGDGPQVRLSNLPAASAKLVRLMQALGFGKIVGLKVVDGLPVLDPSLVVIRETQLRGLSSGHPSMQQGDFYVKAEIVELLDIMKPMRNGVIDLIEVRFGLPSRVAYPVQIKFDA